MQITKFNVNKHMNKLLKILSKRESYLPSKDEMPKIGYIASKEGNMIAVAFLRRCEGNYAQVDGLASNPDVESKERHLALNAVINRCIKKAKELEIKQLFAFSMDSSTIERSIRLGFVKFPHSLLGLDIQKAKL